MVDVMNMAWGGICVENEEISKKEEAVAFPSANCRLGRNSRFYIQLLFSSRHRVWVWPCTPSVPLIMSTA